jgi:hypothetical protein
MQADHGPLSLLPTITRMEAPFVELARKAAATPPQSVATALNLRWTQSDLATLRSATPSAVTLDNESFKRHLARMQRPARVNADGYAVDARGRVGPILHPSEVQIMKNRAAPLNRSQVAECTDRVYRQHVARQQQAEQRLQHQYCTDLRADSGASPSSTLKKLNADDLSGVLQRLYEAPRQRTSVEQQRRDAALKTLERRNNAYRRFSKLPANAGGATEAVERLFTVQLAKQDAERGKLIDKYVVPTGPQVVRLPRTAISEAVDRLMSKD